MRMRMRVVNDCLRSGVESDGDDAGGRAGETLYAFVF